MSNDALFTLHERERANKESFGNISKRLGTASQLPFGHCCLTLGATQGDAVATPSGHIYRKEAMLEYLLDHKKRFQQQEENAEKDKRREEADQRKKNDLDEVAEAERFKEQSDKIKLRDADGALDRKRKRDIDESTKAERNDALKKSSPWLPTFTPSLQSDNSDSSKSKKGKRAASPCTGLPIRAKDLIPLNLTRSTDGNDRYLCGVSKKVITNQNVIALKNTHSVMLEEVAKELAFPTSTCPLTGKPFSKKDVIHLQKAHSSFAASGAKESTVVRLALV